jgi:uncharacterized protein YerC
MKTEIIQKLKSIGIKDENIEEMFELLSQEVLEVIYEDYADISTDEELKSLEQRIKNSKSIEHFQKLIQEVAQTVYEDNYEQEIKNIYLDLVDSLQETINQANDLLQKVNSGDPEAQKLLDKAQQSDTYKNIMSENS